MSDSSPRPTTVEDLAALIRERTQDHEPPPKTPAWKTAAAVAAAIITMLTLAGTGWKIIGTMDDVVDTTRAFRQHTKDAESAFKAVVEELNHADKDRALTQKDVENNTKAIDDLKARRRRR